MTKSTGRGRGNKPGWNGTIEERMERFTQRRGPDDCWLWTGCHDDDGYGKVVAKQFSECHATGAHRVAYILANGPIPDGQQVLHSCDNPPCVNPAHLFLGLPRQNGDDMRAKGRAVNLRGEAHGSAKLRADDVRMIRKRFEHYPRHRTTRPRKGEPTVIGTAKEFGIARSVVTGILTGKIWRDVT